MAGLVRDRSVQYQRVPGVQGMTGEQAASVYNERYGEMPVPATHYATAVTAMRSIEVTPSVAVTSNKGIGQRGYIMKGYHPTEGRQSYEETPPPMNKPVYSSKFQDWLVGPIVNYVLNGFLYRAAGGYPMNLGLSTRVDQLATRSTGGPGPASMLPAPRFRRAPVVPKYSTAPQTYPLESSPG
jgi:hypothetical protein